MLMLPLFSLTLMRMATNKLLLRLLPLSPLLLLLLLLVQLMPHLMLRLERRVLAYLMASDVDNEPKIAKIAMRF